MASQTDIRERVTNEIVTALKNGVVPWRKPWSPGNTGFARNVVSKKSYSGVNRLLLGCAAMNKGFQSQWWGTFNQYQWKKLECRVRQRPADVEAGHWGSKIIFYQSLTTTTKNKEGEEKETTFPLLKEYCVFNSEQVEGAEQFHVQAAAEAATPDFEPAEKVIAATGADIRVIPGDKACYYRPPQDYIQIPPKAQFEQGAGGLAEWYSTALHEIAHWCESRLNWTGSYGMGELRAEMAACFLCAEIGIPSHNPAENHAAYLANWIQTISEDHRAIFKISSAANAAADFILSFSRKEQSQDEDADAA